MDMNYGCDVSNRYTGYLDSSDHGTSMNNSSGKNKRKTKKRRKPKTFAEHPITLVDKSTNTSLTIESDGNDSGATVIPMRQPELQQQDQQQQQQQQQQHNNENDTGITDASASLTSCNDSLVQSYTSHEAKESDDQSNNFNAATAVTTAEIEAKWSEICCEEDKAFAAAAAAAAAMTQRYDEPELEFRDQRVYPTVYFYNSNFGSRNRRVVYDFHDGGHGANGRRFGGNGHNNRHQQGNQNHRNDSQMQSNAQANQNDNTTGEHNDQMEQKKQKKHRDRRYTRNRNRARTEPVDADHHQRDISELHTADDTEKNSNTSAHYESNDGRTASHGQASPTPPAPSSPSAPKQNNQHEFPKNRYNKFKPSMSERTFARRRTDLVRNV